MNTIGGKLVLGAIAGFVATLPMTFAMTRLHSRLPLAERYPLPPRELSEGAPAPGMPASTATLLYHFLYGAAAGGAMTLVSGRRDPVAGGMFGLAIWCVSYLGWIPAARILRFGTSHPARRNALMLAAHVVWGAALTASLRELEYSRTESFSRSASANPLLKDRLDP